MLSSLLVVGSSIFEFNKGAAMKRNAQWVLVGTMFAHAALYAQTPAPQQRLGTERNSSSQRYEINQTFDRSAFYKDNNIWVYNKEFADLFGMPAKHIEGVQGIAAAAFRIEDASYQDCGFGGQENACTKVERCLIDLYFDEAKAPLPWATPIQSQWLPWHASMRWLRPLNRAERPYGMTAVEPAPGIIRNETSSGALVPFADPVTRREAMFTSNQGDAKAGVEEVSGGLLSILGYTRDFYKNLSVVNLQFGCMPFDRKQINIRLDAKKSGAYEAPIARFNRIVLPEGFVQRIKDTMQAQSEKNATFYRNLFPPPLGSEGTAVGPQPARK
ncbi:MAG: hypothetical protein Q8M51_16765 [Polaromonas sp.]|nr:hypothetical protein [Polaromonas sp.]